MFSTYIGMKKMTDSLFVFGVPLTNHFSELLQLLLLLGMTVEPFLGLSFELVHFCDGLAFGCFSPLFGLLNLSREYLPLVLHDAID